MKNNRLSDRDNGGRKLYSMHRVTVRRFFLLEMRTVRIAPIPRYAIGSKVSRALLPLVLLDLLNDSC